MKNEAKDCDKKDDVGQLVAAYVVKRISDFKPTAQRPFVLGLPTGSSPLECYKHIIKLFKDGKYADAVLKYNDAIEADPEVPAFYTNRAFCHLKMENHGLAIADATVALELDKTFVKAYYRRGSAYFALGKYKDALKDLKSVRQLKPSDKDALEKYKAGEKEVRREAFEKAIHSDEPTREAHTLFTAKDVRHGRELVRILSDANQEVPAELERMVQRNGARKAGGGRGGYGRGGGGGRGGRAFGGRQRKW